MFRLWLHFVTAKVYRFFRSELPAAAAWPEPAWHHHQVHIHGQEGDQQTAQTEGEEERVEESVEGNLWKMNHDGRWKEVVWGKGRGKQKVKEPPASSVPATKEDARFLFYFHTLDKFHFSLPPIDISSSSPTFFFFFWICHSCSHHKFIRYCHEFIHGNEMLNITHAPLPRTQSQKLPSVS